MAYLPRLQEAEKRRAERAQRAYEKVCQVRKNETADDAYRREVAGLEWLDDFLLEGKASLDACIFDGEKLKEPRRQGDMSNTINAGYNFGFDIPMGGGKIMFNLYAMDLCKQYKEIRQCPKCKVVYSLPKKIDVVRLRKQKKPKPLTF